MSILPSLDRPSTAPWSLLLTGRLLEKNIIVVNVP